MKKILTITTLILMSNAVFANSCTQPIAWVKSKNFHLNAVKYCQNIRCELVDYSGGVPNQNFWETIVWTFSQGGEIIATNQCTAYPMNPLCDFNMPRTTCAALYSALHNDFVETSIYRVSNA